MPRKCIGFTKEKIFFEQLRACEPGSAEYFRIRDLLAEKHFKIVRHIAQKFLYSGEPIEDLLQEGSIGLLNAIDRFDPALGMEFGTFATPTITGVIRHYLRDCGKSIHEPHWRQCLRYQLLKKTENLKILGEDASVQALSQRLYIAEETVREVLESGLTFTVESLDAPIGLDDDEQLTHHETIEDITQPTAVTIISRLEINKMLGRLPEREHKVVELFFFQEFTKTEIARHLNISTNYVGYLLKRLLKDLKEYCEIQASLS